MGVGYIHAAKAHNTPFHLAHHITLTSHTPAQLATNPPPVPTTASSPTSTPAMLALTLAALLALASPAVAIAGDLDTPAGAKPATPSHDDASALPAQSQVPDSRDDWEGPSTANILLFVAFLLFIIALAAFFYKWSMRRRAAHATRTWQQQYGPPPPAYGHTEHAYPPPPVYAQPSPQPENSRQDKSRPLGRSLSTTSTASTLIGKDRKDGKEHRPSEESDAELAMPQLTSPEAAHKSTWRGRFARNGDQP